MDDLISRQAAIDALRAIKHGLWEIDIPSPTVPEYVEHHEQIKNMMEIVDGWIKRINEEHAVDAATVIRCKDCKNFRRWIDTDLEFCDRTECPTSGDDYCSHGERRESNE